MSAEWTEFQGKRALRVRVQPEKGWAIIRTDNFPTENWDRVTGLRVEGWLEGSGAAANLKLEVRDATDFNTLVQDQRRPWTNPRSWTAIEFRLSGSRSEVGWLSLVVEYPRGRPVVFYFSRIDLITDSGPELWDAMDAAENRNWFYWNNRVNWWHPEQFGAEVKSHNASRSGAAVYLRWDAINGVDTDQETAEVAVGDERAPEAGRLDKRLREDWGCFGRASVDVYCTDPAAPIALFFYGTRGDGSGFGTRGQPVGKANQWVRLYWDLPWPSGFPNDEVDSLHFVVQNIEEHLAGEVFFDNVTFYPSVQPISQDIGIHHTFDDYLDEDIRFNDFHNNWGLLGIENELNVQAFFVEENQNIRLEVRWKDFPKDKWTGIWHSIWGHSDYPEFTLDGNRFEQVQMRLRSAERGQIYNLKIEFKDDTQKFEATAFAYVRITDQWQTFALSMDLDDPTAWSYNQDPPNRARLKELVFVIEDAFNERSGAFQIDWIRFVEGSQPFDLQTGSDEDFVDLVEEKTYRFFDDWTCKEPLSNTYGFTLDRSVFPDLMSVASLGFGLTAHVIGVERGWADPGGTEALVERTLENLLEAPQSDDPRNAIGYRGFFYHFLHHDQDHGDGNGLRKDTTELSIIDTALLIAGALTCREYFDSNRNIRDMATQLYERVEWPFFLHTLPNDRQQFFWGWKPEKEGDFQFPAPGGGYFTGSAETPFTGDYYTDELILMDLLAIGSSRHPISRDVFYDWARVRGTYKGESLIQSFPGSLFTYFFAHCWVDFRNLGKDAPPEGVEAVDWWENSVSAVRANRQFCIDQSGVFRSYGPNSWGLTAAEGPVPPRRLCSDRQPGLYHAYGALPNGENCPISDGTVAPYGAGSSIVFLPNESIAALKNYFETPLWSYHSGFGDAYNLGLVDPLPQPPYPVPPQSRQRQPHAISWKRFDHANFGIDQGPLLIMLENFRSGLIWNLFMRCPEVQTALNLIYSRS